MRYGAVPVVRATGGLADYVTDFGFAFDTESGKDVSVGTGFVFKDFSVLSLYGALVRAIEIYKDKSTWHGIIKRCMRADFSWEQSARGYEKLYKRAIAFHKEKHKSSIMKVRQRMSS